MKWPAPVYSLNVES